MRTPTGMWVRVIGPGYGLVMLAALGVAACGSTSRNGADAWSGSAGSGGGGSPTATEDAGAGGGLETTELTALPSVMHRLNRAEYQATVTDTLGEGVSALLPEDAEINGFDNVAEVQHVSERDYDAYLTAAEGVAADVFASDTAKARFVTCSAEDDAACIGSVISSAGRRLFRRPLLDGEIAAYQKVYAAARTRGALHEGALQQVLVALLASAQFLYRMEFPVGAPGTQPLGPYEVASRLSYLLWSSAPDDNLLNAAQADALAQDEQLTAQVTRMWDDPKSQRFVANFAGQWLGARRLLTHFASPDVYPEWTPEVAGAAAGEIYAYFDDFLRQDLDFSGFYTSRTHFANASLGKLYGVDVSGSELQRINLQGERQGLLGLVGFLTWSSVDRRTSLPLRGKTVVQNLLCLALPPVPPSVPKLEADPGNPTPREYFEGVERDPLCGTCHQLIDPFGVALDRYDGIGRFRDAYPDGRLIDQVARAAPSLLFPDGATLDGLAGAAQAMATDPRSRDCFVQNIYTYGLGHVPNELDGDNVGKLAEQWASNPLVIKELIKRLVISTPFRFRSDGGLP